MKTFSIILAAFAVIAAASADSNAICNGQIGNHAIQERGRDYIACSENTNGEIIAEILTCDHADHIWCPQTEHCCPPEQCVIVIPGGLHGDITIEINNKVEGGCTNCDDNSYSSSSESSSSSSSSEEDDDCKHGHHLQWFEHCEKNGCYAECVEDHHDTRDIGASCHHHDNDYLACCRFGTCTTDKIGQATCREEGKDCPSGTTCCGKGCEHHPPTGPCPEHEHPVHDPTTCTKFCCEPNQFGLFGGAVRGQVQTDCISCGPNKFWCNHANSCVDSTTDNHHCQQERHDRCNCHLEPHPTDCNKYNKRCEDSDHLEEHSCGHEEIFWQGHCINHDHPDWHMAKGECICGPGFEPFPDPHKCTGTNCCPHGHNPAIFGADLKTCRSGPSCVEEHEFWSVTDQCCKNIEEHITEFHETCRCHKEHHPTDCRKFIWVCELSEHTEEGTCEPDHIFHNGHCINHDHPDWHKAEGECICGPGFEPHPSEHHCAETTCCPCARDAAIFGVDIKTCLPGPSCNKDLEFWSVTDRCCKKISEHIEEFHETCYCHKEHHPTDCHKFVWVCTHSGHTEEGTCEPDHIFHNGHCINHEDPDWHKAMGECVCGHGFEPHTVDHMCGDIYCCPHGHDTAIFGADLKTCHYAQPCKYDTEFWSQDDFICKKILEWPEEYLGRCCSDHSSGECRKYNRKCDKKPDQHMDCPADKYWWETGCIGSDNAHYPQAQSKCLCEHLEGKFPESAGTCDTYNCCYPSSTPFDIFGVQPKPGSGTSCENRSCPATQFYCSKRSKCVPVTEQNKADCNDDFFEHCCHIVSAHCHGYKLKCKGDTVTRPVPCPCGEFFCYNRGLAGECGLPELDKPCYTNCNCEDGDDYYNNGFKVCCFKKAVITTDNFWKNFVPSTECSSIKPVCDDCEKWGWASCGNRLCGESTEACPPNPDSDLLFSKLCSECVYDPETEICKTPIWTGTEQNPVQKCSWVGDCKRDAVTGKFEYVLGSVTECHHTGPPTGHGCKVCTMPQLAMLGYTGINNVGCTNEKSFPGKETEYHETCCAS